MQNKTVAFTGFRIEKMPFPEDLSNERYICFRKKLFQIISRLNELGYNRFISGMAQGFDTWCAEDVLSLGASLECAIPFPEQALGWDPIAQQRRSNIIKMSKKQILITKKYKKGCYHERNRYMVDSADVVVCGYSGVKKGGTAYTVDYALKQKKIVIQLNPTNNEVSFISKRKISSYDPS